MNKKYKALLVTLILLIQLPFIAVAQEYEDDDLELLGLELEELLAGLSGILAAALCTLTLVAYKRSKNEKLKFIAIAFLLFSVKSFMIASELVIDDAAWIETTSAVLDFAILLTFFYGVVKR